MTIDSEEIKSFIYREARFMDEHNYDEWLSLWTDEAVYWVPCNHDDVDPDREVSIIYDDRSRLEERITRLKSGLAWSQNPQSRMSRVISNFEIEQEEKDETIVHSNFNLIELHGRNQYIWAGRTIHKLHANNGSLKINYKKVMLINNDVELPRLTFLI